MAYLTQALHRLRSAMQIQDTSRRNAEIDGARRMLFQALADYDNRELLEVTCSARSYLFRRTTAPFRMCLGHRASNYINLSTAK